MNQGAKVDLAASMLDIQRPGWEEEVNVYHLSVRGGGWCVLEQLYGDWSCIEAQRVVEVVPGAFMPWVTWLPRFERRLNLLWREAIMDRRLAKRSLLADVVAPEPAREDVRRVVALAEQIVKGKV